MKNLHFFKKRGSRTFPEHGVLIFWRINKRWGDDRSNVYQEILQGGACVFSEPCDLEVFFDGPATVLLGALVEETVINKKIV